VELWISLFIPKVFDTTFHFRRKVMVNFQFTASCIFGQKFSIRAPIVTSVKFDGLLLIICNICFLTR